ncbi:cob(I)yrinic acid a,c-diamide adenosyltransferase [Aquabacterium sp.]|uniref:cob(I)yrinic acid a,c-diamide adenosyltransferase n=1 Tax=Aquabacterium sp. TaxID=1872578 RepID=UPI0035AF0432
MENRLSRIVTRSGDDGTTGLADGTRLPKSAPRVQALGDVDELNSQLGLLLCEPLPDAVRELLIDVQHELFNLGGELAMPQATLLAESAVSRLETAIETHNAALPPLREFILPGGTRGAVLAHVARTVARRAERSVVALGLAEQTSQQTGSAQRHYLNRLSDLLFVLARVLNRANLDGRGGDDVYWRSERLQKRPG